MGELEEGNFVAGAFRNLVKTRPIRMFSAGYLKSHPYLLERSVLNSEQKRMIMNGIVI